MKNIDRLLLYFPFLLFIVICYVNIQYQIINKQLPGLIDILSSIITFNSIIIGVMVALFGVVVTLSDSDIMKKLQKNKSDKLIFKYSIETLVSNFVLLILSIILQSVVKYPEELGFTQILLSIWIGIVFFSITSSIRTIYYLLLISFNHNDRTKRPESNYSIDDQSRNSLRERNSIE